MNFPPTIDFSFFCVRVAFFVVEISGSQLDRAAINHNFAVSNGVFMHREHRRWGDGDSGPKENAFVEMRAKAIVDFIIYDSVIDRFTLNAIVDIWPLVVTLVISQYLNHRYVVDYGAMEWAVCDANYSLTHSHKRTFVIGFRLDTFKLNCIVCCHQLYWSLLSFWCFCVRQRACVTSVDTFSLFDLTRICQ